MARTNVGSPNWCKPCALWRHRPRSSRGSNAPPRRTGKPSTVGRRGPGDRTFEGREVRVMREATTVLDVLRERGRRGLPLERLYRQLFNPQLYLLAYGRLYSNKGAMTPGPDGETVDGMSLAKIGRVSTRCATSATGSSRSGGPTFPRRTGRKGRWACRPGRTNSSAKWSACFWRRTTNRSSPTGHTGTDRNVVATPLCRRS